MVLGIHRNQQVNNIGNNNVQNQNAVQQGIDYKPSVKSVTSEELFTAMGGRPKSDVTVFGKVINARSTEYKAVANSLDNFTRSFQEIAKTPLENLTKNQVAALKADLTEAFNHATAYQNAHADDPKKASRRDAMENLKASLTQQMTELDTLLDTKTDYEEGTDVGTALAISRGVETPSLVTNPHENDQLVGDLVPLGNGAMNTVYLAKWQKPDNSTEDRVLKPLNVKLPEGANGADVANTLGIEDDHQLVAERNVATNKVAEHLGLQNLAPRSDIIVLDHQVYLEMPLAPGKSAAVPFLVDVDPNRLQEYRQREKQPGGNDTLAMMRIVKTGEDQNGESLFALSDTTYIAYPFASSVANDTTAGLQEGLLNLQLLDALTGQADRNVNNVFISVTDQGVTVTGIDHDLSFGEKAGKDVTDFSPKVGFGYTGQFTGLPPLLTRNTFDNLMAIDPAQYKLDLEESGLNDQQVSLAMTRFDKIIDHAIKLEGDGLIVADLTANITDPITQQSVSVSDFLTSRPNDSYVGKMNNLQQLTLDANIALIPME